MIEQDEEKFINYLKNGNINLSNNLVSYIFAKSESSIINEELVRNHLKNISFDSQYQSTSLLPDIFNSLMSLPEIPKNAIVKLFNTFETLDGLFYNKVLDYIEQNLGKYNKQDILEMMQSINKQCNNLTIGNPITPNQHEYLKRCWLMLEKKKIVKINKRKSIWSISEIMS